MASRKYFHWRHAANKHKSDAIWKPIVEPKWAQLRRSGSSLIIVSVSFYCRRKIEIIISSLSLRAKLKALKAIYLFMYTNNSTYQIIENER